MMDFQTFNISGWVLDVPPDGSKTSNKTSAETRHRGISAPIFHAAEDSDVQVVQTSGCE
ncbi:MAG: hypothetical protein P1P77_01590 [Spirochaetaceae bacterium]|nr:hypothetical protein [Spirochaetaceae bacterium]